MNYWRINTDREAIAKDTSDIWYKEGMAFTGDYANNKGKHAVVLKKFKKGDGLFVHHNKAGIVLFGIVEEEWDGNIYTGKYRKLYEKEFYEYRIKVNWLPEYDRRKKPLCISNRLPYRGTYCRINPEKYDIKKILSELRVPN